MIAVMMLHQKAQNTWSSMITLPNHIPILSPGSTPATNRSRPGTTSKKSKDLFHEKLRFDAEVVERLKAREVVKYLRLTEMLRASLQQREMRPTPVVTPGIAWIGGSNSRILPILGKTGLDDDLDTTKPDQTIVEHNQVGGGGFVLRAWRDSNPQPPDP